MEEGKVLVHDDTIEQRVLGCLMQYQDSYFNSSDRLCKELFHNYKHQRIFEAVSDIYERGEVADVVSVAMWFIQRGETSFGPSDLTEICNTVVSSVTYEKDLSVLEDFAHRRRGWVVAQKMLQASYSMMGDMEDVEKELQDFLQHGEEGKGKVLSMSDVNNHLRSIVRENIKSSNPTGIKTGFKIFDDFGGFHLSDFNVIGADSSQGKTTLALNIAKNAAKSGVKVMIYSMEMLGRQMSARINSAMSGISASTLLYKRLDSGQVQQLERSMSETDDLPIYFDEDSSSTAQSINSSIRKHAKKGVKLFIVDYLQILGSTERVKNEEAFYGQVTRDLKNLAKKLDVCIVALSQLRRDNLNPRPTMARLRASGQIAEAADIIVLIYRPSVYGKVFDDTTIDASKCAELIQTKGRNVGLDSVIVGYSAERSEFYDLTEIPKIPMSGKGKPAGKTTATTTAPPQPNEGELPF